jgi:hypothetical protein
MLPWLVGKLGVGLKSGFVAAATAAAFYAVGQVTSGMPGAIPGANGAHGTFVPLSPGHLANIVGHALVGCAQSAASGGKCGPGALAGAVTSAAGPFINTHNVVDGLVANTILGGLASVAGGGKFANGAITGAFGYLLNEAGRAPNDRHAEGVDLAKQYYTDMGFDVSSTSVSVVVPGFDTPECMILLRVVRAAPLGSKSRRQSSRPGL